MIDSVFIQGDDALVNIAEINIQSPIFKLLENLKFRTTQISIPEFSIETFEIHHITQKFTLPSGKDGTPKTMSFTVRVDKYYTIYKALMAWLRYFCGEPDDKGNAYIVQPNKQSYSIVKVRCVDSNGVTTTEGWTFKMAYIQSIGAIEFDAETGEPIKIQCTIAYGIAIPEF
jgi:hypothetical protein